MNKNLRSENIRDCQPNIDILWCPYRAMRHSGAFGPSSFTAIPATSTSGLTSTLSPLTHAVPADCFLAVSAARPRMAAALLSLMLLSLFLTFHVLYDSAVLSLQAASAASERRAAFLAAHTVRDVGSINSIHNAGRMSHPLAPRRSDRSRFKRSVKRLPQALIIGARKCGTRALLEMLCLHPQVQKAAGEVHFFDRDENYRKGLEWYRSKMPPSLPGQITIEKSPSYFVTPEVPERVRAMNASIKLLLIVREPVTRAISDYTQLRSRATAPPQALPSFEHLALRSDGTVDGRYRPLGTSAYHIHLARWLDAFPREQLLLVDGDRLVEDPAPQLERAERFLGLPPRIERRQFYFNATKGFFCLRDSPNATGRCLRESKGRRHARVAPAAVTTLRKFFAEHNQRFYELAGEDMGWPEE